MYNFFSIRTTYYVTRKLVLNFQAFGIKMYKNYYEFLTIDRYAI